MKRASFKCVVLFAVISIGGMASASTWTGGAGPEEPYWDIAQNWDTGAVPSATDSVTINNVLAPDGVTVLSPIIDEFVTNAECTVVNVGNNGTGSLVMTGGKLTGSSDFVLGNTAGDTGLMNMDGGTITITGHFKVGGAGTGHLRMAGGEINAGKRLMVPQDGNSGVGRLDLFGGTIKASDRLVMRAVERSVMDISGGTLILGGDAGLTNYCNGGNITAYGGRGTVNVEVVGDTWVLTGTADPAVMAKAWQPSPADTAALSTNQVTLAWVAGKGAETHKVYLGKAPDALEPLPADPNQGVLSVDFHTTVTDLDLGTTYYWRVDEIAADGSVATGDVWSFTALAPEVAKPVSPQDGATGVDTTDLLLQWEPGQGAINHDVYFGTDAANLALVSDDQTEPNYLIPETLIGGMTYYWRVDEFDGTNTHTGLVASFKTSAPAASDWTGAAGDNLWSNPDNWSAGLPGIGTIARLRNDGLTVIDANTAAYCTKLELGWSNANNAELQVKGGSLTIEGELTLSRMLGSVSTLRISGGVVNCGFIRGWHGDMLVSMTGGELNVAGNLEIPRDYAADVGTIGIFDLLGGLVRADSLQLNPNANVLCELNLTGGKLILNSDKTSVINGYIDAGLIRAYLGTGSASMMYDADADKTIVIGCEQVLRADFNADCVVDARDRDLLMSEWGYQTPSEVVYDFDMSTDPVGPDANDMVVRDAASGNYTMDDAPGMLRVLGPLLLDPKMPADGLWDCELHFVARALSSEESRLALWLNIATTAEPTQKAYVGVTMFLDASTNTQTVKIWNGNPPHVPPTDGVVVTGLAADAMIDIKVYYHHDTDTYDWTITDGTITDTGTGFKYHPFNGGTTAMFTIQGITGTSGYIDHFSWKIHGSNRHSVYDINVDGVVDQLDLDILESEMGK